MPVLRGLVNETANKATSVMEQRIQPLEDQLKAAAGKTPSKAKKSKDDGKKSPQGILKNKGTPAAPKKTTAPHTLRAARDENNKGPRAPKQRRNPRNTRYHSMGRRPLRAQTHANR
jgi:hypothetical protein